MISCARTSFANRWFWRMGGQCEGRVGGSRGGVAAGSRNPEAGLRAMHCSSCNGRRSSWLAFERPQRSLRDLKDGEKKGEIGNAPRDVTSTGVGELFTTLSPCRNHVILAELRMEIKCSIICSGFTSEAGGRPRESGATVSRGYGGCETLSCVRFLVAPLAILPTMTSWQKEL